MTVSMYTVSVPVFIQHLNGLSAVLDKAAAWAAARKVAEPDLLAMRLSPDMFNLARQVRAATDHAANAAGRLSGKELLKFANDETNIAQLKERIAKVIEYLNKALRMELTAVNQYWLHYRLVEDWGYAKLAKKDRSTVFRALAELEKLGEIRREISLR